VIVDLDGRVSPALRAETALKALIVATRRAVHAVSSHPRCLPHLAQIIGGMLRADQVLAAEVEQTLLQYLTADEERVLRVRFGLGNGPREAAPARAKVHRIERRALIKLRQSSYKTGRLNQRIW
jgi:hypothetical protein